MVKRNYRVAAIFDTETTNIGTGVDTRAFACLYIVNDIRGVNISNYILDKSDNIKFYRNSKDMLEFIDVLIADGKKYGYVPIIAAYNLSFDMQTIIYELNARYAMKVLAQSGTSYYTLDILDEEEEVILRFWDTFFLEMGGLSAMGRTCGVPKANGDWDYSLTRTQDTPLTESELHYASRDVQVIPAYLAWLLKANEHIKESDLGVTCLTKTSIVRLMGSRVVGKLKDMSGKTTYSKFRVLAKNEDSKNIEQYSLRKACFRGGLTFTASNTAMQFFNNVASFDVVSMHHAFINGRHIPVNFNRVTKDVLEVVIDRILSAGVDEVLSSYERPLPLGANITVEFTNLRPKKDSVFERAGIYTLAYNKFNKVREETKPFEPDDIRNIMLENAYRSFYSDKVENGTYAFGKLIKGDTVRLNLTELELWIVGQVYDFDSYKGLDGETTYNFRRPPAYVSLQSNLLFEQKSVVKKVLEKYNEGTPYEDKDDLMLLPDNLQKEISEGVCSSEFLKSYYTSTIKGMYNGIYGTMAQDIRKPDFQVEEGDISVVKETMPNADNFDERTQKNVKVLYTYGARIVGGSRMHLIIAIILIDRALGDKAQVLGGDTDSLKIQMNGCTVDDILDALKPLHDAIDLAITDSQGTIRENFPFHSSQFKDVGHFEYEGTTYTGHVELWNKGRISYDGTCHLTLAGVPRPKGSINAETFCNAYVEKNGVDSLPNALGYNVTLAPEVAHYLGTHKPMPDDIFSMEVTDYLGNTSKVRDYEAVALYPSGKILGATHAKVNADNVRYLRSRGVEVDTMDKWVRVIDDKIVVESIEGVEYYG